METDELTAKMHEYLRDPDLLLDDTLSLYDSVTAGLSPLTTRIGDLVLARESGANKYLEMKGLISQIAGIFGDEISGLRAVANLGIQPVTQRGNTLVIEELIDGEVVRTKVHMERLREGNARAVLFIYRGTAYLYSLASAAKLNEMGDQDFTALFIKVISRLRPLRLRSIAIDRYVRSQEVAGLLLHACSRHVDQVWIGRQALEMRGPRSTTDKLLFVILATGAALERNALVGRMGGGKMNKVLNNGWQPGAHSVPPGYELVNQHLEVRPDQRWIVRGILEAIVDDLPPREFAKRLGALGLRTKSRAGSDATTNAAHMASPDKKQSQMCGYTALWATGEHVFRVANPYPGAENVNGNRVVKRKDGGEELHIVVRPGVPEGGWAEPELCEAALAVARRRAPREKLAMSTEVLSGVSEYAENHAISDALRSRDFTTATKAPRAMIWAGAQWSTDVGAPMTWRLRGKGERRYQVVRWASPPRTETGTAAAPPAAQSQLGGEAVMYLPGTLLDGLPAALAAALREGVPVERLTGLSSWSDGTRLLVTRSDDDRRAAIGEQLDRARLAERNARTSALGAKDDQTRAMWTADREEAAIQVRKLEAALADLKETVAPPALTDVFKTEVDYLLTAIKHIASSTKPMDREVVYAQNGVFEDRRIHVRPNSVIDMATHIRLPVDGGVADLGPVTWRPREQPALSFGLMWAAMENAGHPSPWLSRPRPPYEVPYRTKHMSVDDESLEMRAIRFQYRDLHDQLEEAGIGKRQADALLNSSFPAVPHIVLAKATGAPIPSWVGPEWADPAWTDWLHHYYTQPEFAWGGIGWGLPAWLRQACLDVTIEHGGSISAQDLFDSLQPQRLGTSELNRISNPAGAVGKKGQIARSIRFPLTRTGQWGGGMTTTSLPRNCRTVFTVIRCQRCGEVADTAVRIAELEGDLMCPNGHLPLAEDERLANITVPSDYRWLRVPRSIWSARACLRGAPGNTHVTDEAMSS